MNAQAVFDSYAQLVSILKKRPMLQSSPLDLKKVSTLQPGGKIFVTQKYSDSHKAVDLVVTNAGLHFIAGICNPFEKAVVIWSGNISGAGKSVILLNITDFQITNENRVLGFFCHLDRIYDRIGEVLMMGEKFSEMGNTGGRYFHHLHFMLSKVTDRNANVIDYKTLLKFAVDPLPEINQL